jgi:hypothetical protein
MAFGSGPGHSVIGTHPDSHFYPARFVSWIGEKEYSFAGTPGFKHLPLSGCHAVWFQEVC